MVNCSTFQSIVFFRRHGLQSPCIDFRTEDNIPFIQSIEKRVEFRISGKHCGNGKFFRSIVRIDDNRRECRREEYKLEHVL